MPAKSVNVKKVVTLQKAIKRKYISVERKTCSMFNAAMMTSLTTQKQLSTVFVFDESLQSHKEGSITSQRSSRL